LHRSPCGQTCTTFGIGVVVVDSSPSSMILLISANDVSWRSFSKSAVAHVKMGHMSQTTPLSGTVCSPYAGTSYDRPVYQIWNLYFDPLRRYERWQKMHKLGWFGC